MNLILPFILGYLIGSIPFALIIGKVFYKTDIRKHGSGNLGGSNAGRVLGKKAGAIVITLDVIKAIIPVLLIQFFVGYDEAIVTGLAVAIGHCYPIFANFKGGKAVATSFGYVGAITVTQFANYTMFPGEQFVILLLLPLLILFLVVKTSKYVSLGSITSFASSMILSFIIQDNFILSISFSFLWLFIVFRHWNNIKKLMNGTETKITW